MNTTNSLVKIELNVCIQLQVTTALIKLMNIIVQVRSFFKRIERMRVNFTCYKWITMIPAINEYTIISF